MNYYRAQEVKENMKDIKKLLNQYYSDFCDIDYLFRIAARIKSTEHPEVRRQLRYATKELIGGDKKLFNQLASIYNGL